MSIAIYPGTFDPFTNGHRDLVLRASKVFEQVIVAVAQGQRGSKHPLFSVDERVLMAKQVLSDLGNVQVLAFNSLLVDFAQKNAVDVIIRGLRVVTDFDYEFQLAAMNRRLAPDVETIFLTPAEQFSFISSSLVKEVSGLGGDVSDFVQPSIVKALQLKQARLELD